MSKVVIEVLEAAVLKYQKQIAKLEEQITADHIGEYSKHIKQMSELVKEAKGTEEHLGKITYHQEKAQNAWNKSRYQQDNLSKWIDSQTTLKLELSELSRELSSKKMRERCKS
jgi:chromosome segregation ATPase